MNDANGDAPNTNDQTVFLALDLAGYSLDDILHDEMTAKRRYNGEMAIKWVSYGQMSLCIHMCMCACGRIAGEPPITLALNGLGNGT